MAKRGLHMFRRSTSSDLNLIKSDVKVRTDNRNEPPVTSRFDSHLARSFAPDIGISESEMGSDAGSVVGLPNSTASAVKAV